MIAADIATQVGAPGGLWTGTPVDWRGNETGLAEPTTWPSDASVAVPPNGSRLGATAPPPVGPPPTITAVSATDITATEATVNWTVQPLSSSVVEYGETAAYGSATESVVGAGAQSLPFAGLTTATLYHYRIAATANGQSTRSPDSTFTTL